MPVRPEIHGHRGARGLWPENTLAACAGALAIGVDAIEIDVLASADGHIVVHHDPHLNDQLARDARGRWLEPPTPALFSLTLAELKALDVGRVRPGSALAARFPAQRPADGERIPTLAEVARLLDRDDAARVLLNIEAKSSPLLPDTTPPPARFAALLGGEIARLGIERRVLVQSFDWRFLQSFESAMPGVATAYLTEARAADDEERLWTGGRARSDFGGSVPAMVHAAGGRAWAAHHDQLHPAALDEARRLELRIYAWTVNEVSRMTELARAGIHGIITDYPDRLRYTLAGMGFDVTAPPEARLAC